MKVKCILLFDVFGRRVETSPWLTVGRIYHVLGINVRGDGRIFYHIVTHDEPGEWPSMGYYESRCFEMISNTAPSNWRVLVNRESISIEPEAWHSRGFLEAFHDHEPTTLPIFERERAVILAEDA